MTATFNYHNVDDRELAKRALAEYDLTFGDFVYIEEETRGERRGFVGQILFAFVTQKGDLCVTYSGKSGWAPGSGSACLVGSNPHMAHVVRKLTREDRAKMAHGRLWSFEPHPLNWREQDLSYRARLSCPQEVGDDRSH